jgi:hypothetical protein
MSGSGGIVGPWTGARSPWRSPGCGSDAGSAELYSDDNDDGNDAMTAPPTAIPTERRWYPTDADYRRIWDHIVAQNGIDVTRFVRLDDGRVVPIGDGE